MISPVAFNVRVQSEDFDLGASYLELRELAANAGAIVIFTGLVREIQGATAQERSPETEQSLTLEHYPGMTEKSLQRIVSEAAERWPLQAITLVHRIGKLLPGDQIVLVAVASAHRDAAFAGAEFIMDYLKTSAPFWKKQQWSERSEWISSKSADYERAARWRD
jgi:molybdopterin synthase catalytic subunit